MDTITNTELAILGLVAEYPRYGYQVEQDIALRGMRNWTEIGFSSIYYVLNRMEAAGWLASDGSDGETGRGEDGEMGRGGDREMGRQGDEEMPHAAEMRDTDDAASNIQGSSITGSPDLPVSLSPDLPVYLSPRLPVPPSPSLPILPPASSRRAGPARKVYHLTEAGRVGLHAAVLERLTHPRPRTGDFDLALANLPVLTPEEVHTALETYHTDLQQRLAQVRAKWGQDRAASAQAHQPFPPHVDALFEHSIAMIEAEVEWVGKKLKTVSGNPVPR